MTAETNHEATFRDWLGALDPRRRPSLGSALLRYARLQEFRLPRDPAAAACLAWAEAEMSRLREARERRP